MVRRKRIIWTINAKKEFIETCSFWNRNNKSPHYSIKLRKLVNAATERISLFPYGGIPSLFQDVRFIVVKDYLLFYNVSDKAIYILSFWDGRQDPYKLKKRLE